MSAFLSRTSLPQSNGRHLSSILPQYTVRYGDAVVLALTSRPQPDDVMMIDHWRQAGLPKPTWIKPLVATLATTRFTQVRRAVLIAPS